MAYTDNNQLENQADGQADWDNGLNANFTTIDRGFHRQFAAGTGVSTGDIMWLTTSGTLLKYDPRSLSLGPPTAMAYKAVASGETDRFLLRGVVSSIGVWSGNIAAGQPVYAAPSTAGFAVSSYAAADHPAGIALSATAIFFSPSQYRSVPEEITQVQSLGLLAIGSTHTFTLSVGNRGYVRRVEVNASSFNLWTMKFHSGSARVSSELLFETASGGVTSTYALDAAGFPFKNTDVASLGLVFGNILVSSGVGSAHINLTVSVDRFR